MTSADWTYLAKAAALFVGAVVVLAFLAAEDWP